MNSQRTWTWVVILSAIFATNANAQTEIDKLRKCLTIEDGSKERLDCYDGIISPAPKPKLPVAKAVADCKFLGEASEAARLEAQRARADFKAMLERGA